MSEMDATISEKNDFVEGFTGLSITVAEEQVEGIGRAALLGGRFSIVLSGIRPTEYYSRHPEHGI